MNRRPKLMSRPVIGQDPVRGVAPLRTSRAIARRTVAEPLRTQGAETKYERNSACAAAEKPRTAWPGASPRKGRHAGWRLPR